LVSSPITRRVAVRITIPVAVVAIGIAAPEKEERQEQDKITHWLLLELLSER
jgi:hypothetical protein